MVKKLTESERKRLLRQYNSNEDRNYHTENAINLIKRFGTSTQLRNAKKKLIGIRRRHSVSETDARFFSKKGHVHYSKLVTSIRKRRSKK